MLAVFNALLLLQTAKYCCADSIQRQIESNQVTFDKRIVSPNGEWTALMETDPNGNFSLVISHAKTSKVIDRSPKPDFRICWSQDGNYMVIVRPVGFTKMVKVLSLNKSRGEMSEVFASEKSNQRKFVDYGLQRWDLKQGVVVFNVYENPRYLEGRKRILLATEYIYLDGRNGY
jgi:hypothetical protein